MWMRVIVLRMPHNKSIMSISIKSVSLNNEADIVYRSITVSGGKLVQSVNVNQTDGTFVTTEPINQNGQIVVYPQSPNNPRYEIKTYKTFGGYGSIDFPLDARFDSIRRKVWIADAGNTRAIKVSTNNYKVEQVISNIILPHSVVPEVNLGGVFIKGFSGVSTGVIYYHGANGELVDYFTYPCALGKTTTEIEYTNTYVKSLPIPSTMAYDPARWRLWWTSGTFVYMIDIRNQQAIQQNLAPIYTNTRGLDIDFDTGNAFVVVNKPNGNWFLVQLFRDNNFIFCSAYILPVEVF